jgi:hypothetical protein
MDIHFPVAGVKFRPVEAQAVANTLEEGDQLELELEPSNKFDPKAIKIIEPESGAHIGYVPRSHNSSTHENLQMDLPFTAEVSRNGDKLIVNVSFPDHA